MKLKLINKFLLATIAGVTILSACSYPEHVSNSQKVNQVSQSSHKIPSELYEYGYRDDAGKSGQFNNLISINKTIPSTKEIVEAFDSYTDLIGLKDDKVLESLALYAIINPPLKYKDTEFSLISILEFYMSNDWSRGKTGLTLQHVILDPTVWHLPAAERFEQTVVKPSSYKFYSDGFLSMTSKDEHQYLYDIMVKIAIVNVDKLDEFPHIDSEFLKKENFDRNVAANLITNGLGLSNNAKNT